MLREKLFPQRRKGAEFEFEVFLCAFAPLREN
jgi:hypothetical protein